MCLPRSFFTSLDASITKTKPVFATLFLRPEDGPFWAPSHGPAFLGSRAFFLGMMGFDSAIARALKCGQLN
jgi:hypothetical protein